MKNTLTMVIWLSGTVLLAQPVLEHTYSESAAITSLDNLGEVYYTMNVTTKQCQIYDLDHTLLKSISIPTPTGYYLVDIQFVSEHLFNEDDLVELVYIYSRYVPTTNSFYYVYEAKLIDENSTILLTMPGVGFTNVAETSDQGLKFLAYKFDYSVIPYLTETQVYSLPGGSTKAADRAISPAGMGNAYPNPATRLVNIPVDLPEGTAHSTLILTDLQGRHMMNYPVTGSDTRVVLPAGNLPPGTYLYHIRTGNNRTEARKLQIR